MTFLELNPENYAKDAHDSLVYKSTYLFFVKNWRDSIDYFDKVIADANNNGGGSGNLFISTATITQASREAIKTAMRYLLKSKIELNLRSCNCTNEVEEGKREIQDLHSKEQNIFWCGTFNFNGEILNKLANNPIEFNIDNRNLSDIYVITDLLNKAG